MAIRHILVVRHGQTLRTDESTDFLGNGLTELGQAQARLVAARLEGLKVHAIHYSTLHRAAQTARLIAAALPGARLVPSSLLWECIPYLPRYFVEWYHTEGPGTHPLDDGIPAMMRPWLKLWSASVTWNTISEGLERAPRAFAEYFQPVRRERRELLVCHGNILRYFVVRAMGVPPDAWINIDVNNCGVSEFQVGPDGKVLLLSHNDTGHLPFNMRSYN